MIIVTKNASPSEQLFYQFNSFKVLLSLVQVTHVYMSPAVVSLAPSGQLAVTRHYRPRGVTGGGPD